MTYKLHWQNYFLIVLNLFLTYLIWLNVYRADKAGNFPYLVGAALTILYFIFSESISIYSDWTPKPRESWHNDDLPTL